jgi:UDP-N-acetylmuramoyl-L-alanyl-D-glutamate--2,6-diaminopimelate ligase
MQLKGLLDGQEYTLVQGDIKCNIKGIHNDSRKIEEDFVFVAIKGFEQDGHVYIGQSINNGATAIVLEDSKLYEGIIPEDVVVVQVENGRKVLSSMATHFYNHPSSQFKLCGVTGTNGKTSTVFLINNVLEYVQRKTGLIGTILNKIGDETFETERTTPESIEVKKLFKQMADANVQDVIMEVSSHALDLYRVAYTQFDVAVFTNLTLDHLDYHKTMENYRNAKMKLFQMAEIGVINIDDEAGRYILEHSSCKNHLTYSIKDSSATLFASNIVNHLSGASFELSYQSQKYQIKLQTPGEFSVYNGLAAIGACLSLNVEIQDIILALENNSRIKGRFETIESIKGYIAIVDYAHAPDGLENVLQSMKGFAPKRIITVFGCGGDRDKSKRPIMGEIGGRYSDYCIITSDNPRTEDPEQILDGVENGIQKTKCPYLRILDRRQAIHKALEIAEKEDLVLVAGKGHEDYQIIGKDKIHFDDAEEIKNYIKENENVD